MNYAKLEARIRELRERYDLLKQWQDIPKEEFMQDPMKNRAVIRVLQEAIEVCISIANQIVSEMNYGKPKTYAEAFEILARHNVIDDDFEKNLERMVDLGFIHPLCLCRWVKIDHKRKELLEKSSR